MRKRLKNIIEIYLKNIIIPSGYKTALLNKVLVEVNSDMDDWELTCAVSGIDYMKEPESIHDIENFI